MVTPSERSHESAYMVAVVGDPEVKLDRLGDSGGGPQLCLVAVGHRSFYKEGDETFFLLFGEFCGTPRNGLRFQAGFAVLVALVAPAHDGAWIATDPSPDFVERETSFKEFHGLAASPFQLLRRSERSHMGILLSGYP